MEDGRSEVQGQPELYSKFEAGVAATRDPISKSNTTLGGLNVEWCGFYTYNIPLFDRERRRGPGVAHLLGTKNESNRGKQRQATPRYRWARTFGKDSNALGNNLGN